MATFLTKPVVQGYFAPSSVAVGPTGYIDRVRGRIMGIYNSTKSEAFFDFFSGALLSTQDLTAIGVSTGGASNAIIASPADGNLWCFNGTGPVLEICSIDPTKSPWKIDNQWGTGGIPSGIGGPYSMAWLQLGNGNWIVAGDNLGGHVATLQATPGVIGFWGNYFAASSAEDVAVCSGPQGPMSAAAYWIGAEGVLGSTAIQSLAATYSPALWPITNAGITSAVIKTYAPTDFDAAWSAITAFLGPAYDSGDGNVLVQVAGSGGGNQYYIAKLNTTTGAVVWKVPVSNNTGFSGGMQFSRIDNGTFLYYAQVSTFGGTLYAINTSDGSFTTESTTGLLSFGAQASDDVLGCIIGQPGWDASHGNLILLNSTPSSGNTLGAVYFIQSMPIPLVPLSAISYARTWGSWNV